ncbi:hypothetical protein [uncultured Paraglaciecola sp.]|uniref:hypothetical protein n=1 Tax=uncultured Paraglaciecola sp. TaxID=1765024 RepID=UPI00261A2F3E|nr:hypothetical protein [uncultured Paraglaciecola sp.]
MIKLSQRAWNNVIIVSMLMLITIFNFSNTFLNDTDEETAPLRSLVPENMTITTMEFAKDKVERIGQGWRTTSGRHSHEALVSLVNNWKRAEISLQENEAYNHEERVTVTLWFAGHTSPVVYQFVPEANKTLVMVNDKTYLLIRPSYQALTLSE